MSEPLADVVTVPLRETVADLERLCEALLLRVADADAVGEPETADTDAEAEALGERGDAESDVVDEGKRLCERDEEADEEELRDGEGVTERPAVGETLPVAVFDGLRVFDTDVEALSDGDTGTHARSVMVPSAPGPPAPAPSSVASANETPGQLSFTNEEPPPPPEPA